MTETSAMNLEGGIKTEVEVKPEPAECAVCGARAADSAPVRASATPAGTPLADCLCRLTHGALDDAAARHVCKPCHDLINVLEQAELEYLKLKETFDAIISKNPLFEAQVKPSAIGVKLEFSEDCNEPSISDDDDDKPLSLTKKKRHRKAVKRKKKVYSTAKRKTRATDFAKDSWECCVCGAAGAAGGGVALAAHTLAAHTLDCALDNPALRDVKKEHSVDGSESSHFNNGLDGVFKLEIADFGTDDDDSSNFVPDDLISAPRKPSKRKSLNERPGKRKGTPKQDRKKREITKAMHQCDQCEAKYTSIRRLEVHREKHSEGKPPYICEVCGARYKHKRACDIHVALHKGISDWKCEECNKLFPSKGALQRHNNIHTGKLNYQCDLCGKSFIHTSSFKMHKLSHSGVKPHACDVCGLALMTRSHLKRHKRVHSGEKRHECKVCGKRFSERYNLAAHAKSHEGAPEEEAAGAGGGAGAEPKPPRRRLFRCTFCQERYERRYMLERHMSGAHGRTLERVPATPRNTMSKLLKAQAQARQPPAPPAAHPAPHQPPAATALDPKEERSPEPRAAAGAGLVAHKLHLSSTSTTITAGSWSGAYAAEFGLRHDFPH